MKASQATFKKISDTKFKNASKYQKADKRPDKAKNEIESLERMLTSEDHCTNTDSIKCTSNNIGYNASKMSKTLEKICSDRPEHTNPQAASKSLTDYPDHCDIKTAQIMDSIHREREKDRLKNESACESLDLDKSCTIYDRKLIGAIRKNNLRIKKEKDSLNNLIQKLNIGIINLDGTNEFEREELNRRAKLVKELKMMNKKLDEINKTNLKSDITNFSQRKKFKMDNLIKASQELRKKLSNKNAKHMN